MKKCVVNSLLFLILIGCSSNEEVQIKVEEEEQIAELKESFGELERSHQAIIEENEKLQTLLIEESSSFDPLTIEEGDQVAGLKVTNVERDVMNNELYAYSVSFNGGMQLEGDLRIDTAEGQGYITQLSKEQIMQTPHTIDKPFPQGESFRDFAQRVREFLDEKSKEHREHTIITIGWRLSPAILAHVCRGVSLERAITDNANISGPSTYG